MDKTDNTVDDIPDSWMVRPCEAYYDEYKECKSMKGRFHQYFVHGDRLDCSKWQEDLENCMAYRKLPDPEILEKIVVNERERREKRLAGAKSNDVWEYRTEPPGDWNKQLPDHLQKKMPKITTDPTDSKLCVIS